MIKRPEPKILYTDWAWYHTTHDQRAAITFSNEWIQNYLSDMHRICLQKKNLKIPVVPWGVGHECGVTASPGLVASSGGAELAFLVQRWNRKAAKLDGFRVQPAEEDNDASDLLRSMVLVQKKTPYKNDDLISTLFIRIRIYMRASVHG